MPNIFITEDDKALRNGIALALKNHGTVFGFENLEKTRAALSEQTPDLFIMDIGLPDGSGLDFCIELRKDSDTPIIFLTAKDTELDEVMGLEAGADDYITKPFSLAVLRARVEAVLRRRQSFSGERHIGDLTLDFSNMRFSKAGAEVSLSKTEQKLLRLLIENSGRTLTRELLLDCIWGTEEYVDENALSVAVRRLRSKLEDDPKNPKHIQTVYGVGYCWKVKS